MTANDRTAYARPGTRLTREELGMRYDLTEADLAFVQASARGDTGRLVLATLLKARRDLGCFPALEEVHSGILTHLAVQLGLAVVRSSFDELRRTKSLYRYQAAVRLYLSVTAYGDAAELLVKRTVLEAAETMSDPADLINRSIEALQAASIDLPAFSTLDRSGWAQCALPHRRLPPGDRWEIAGERMRLVVEPGLSASGPDAPMEPIGVPYGSVARLILLFLQTEALRTNSREVELGGSLRQWLTKIGAGIGGSSSRAVRDQAERISRCRLTFHIHGSGKVGLVNQSIVDRALFIEEGGGGRQGRLSLDTAKLSEGFFDQLKKHPVPLEEAAIRAISNNPAAIDAYLWLAYRLHVLPGDKLVTWAALKGQFGNSYRELFHFKPRFAHALALALAVYPAAKVEVTEQGVILKPSRPPVAPRLRSA